jgi:hypothetical protein
MMKKTVFTELQKTVEKECKEGKYKLPKKFKTDWINNLRSGLFEQTEGVLRNDDGYCCLGVACISNGYSDEHIWGDEYIRISRYHTDDLSNMPKILVGDDKENDLIKFLTLLNDEKNGYGFQEISDWIETHVENE